jgi:ribosomal protein L11 methyltransferase
MAFGTGSHESTQLMLCELEDLDLEGQAVLDVGCGSGILCLAALSRGAGSAMGLDIDPQSVWVARQIAMQQERPLKPAYVIASLAAFGGGGFDLVLCNMIAERFLPLLKAIRRLARKGATVIFSGILELQRAEVLRALAANGLQLVGERQLADWLSITARRD